MQVEVWVRHFLATPYDSHQPVPPHDFPLNDYYHQQGIIVMAYKAGYNSTRLDAMLFV